jgi:hypothetical protein
MSKVAIVEKGVVVYRGGLPKNWKNSSGLHNSKDDWDTLAGLGIYPLEEVFPSYDSATEVLEGWTEDTQADKVVLTWIKRSITDNERSANAESVASAYKYLREQEYDKLNQWEMQFDDQRDGTTTWVDSINEIKVRFPK